MDSLLEDIMIKGDGDMVRLRSLQPFQEPLSQLREQVDALTDEYVATVLGHMELKRKEREEFSTAMDYAKAEASAESKAEIARYSTLAKATLSETGENVVAVLQTLHKANDALFEKLMDLEVSQSERYAESISTFESAYDELTKRTFEVLQVFFAKLRDLETSYHERLVAAGSELLERVVSDHADNIPVEARTLLQDKDTLNGVINVAHDARVARLDAKEDELRTLEDLSNKATIKSAVDAEYHRNRTRVIEIWNMSSQNRDELAAVASAAD